MGYRAFPFKKEKVFFLSYFFAVESWSSLFKLLAKVGNRGLHISDFIVVWVFCSFVFCFILKSQQELVEVLKQFLLCQQVLGGVSLLDCFSAAESLCCSIFAAVARPLCQHRCCRLEIT